MFSSTPKKPRTSPYQVSLQDVRLLHKVNSHMRLRDEIASDWSPLRSVEAPTFSTKSSSQVSPFYKENLVAYEAPSPAVETFQRHEAKVESPSDHMESKVTKFGCECTTTSNRDIDTSFQLTSKHMMHRKTTRKLSFDSIPDNKNKQKIELVTLDSQKSLLTLLMVLRAFVLFVLACLVLNFIKSYQNLMYCDSNGTISTTSCQTCSKNAICSSGEMHCEEGFIALGESACIYNNSINQLLVKIYPDVLNIVQDQLRNNCSWLQSSCTVTLKTNTLHSLLSKTYEDTYQVQQAICKLLTTFLPTVPNIVLHSTNTEEYQYIICMDTISWIRWTLVQLKQHWFLALTLLTISLLENFSWFNS